MWARNRWSMTVPAMSNHHYHPLHPHHWALFVHGPRHHISNKVKVIPIIYVMCFHYCNCSHLFPLLTCEGNQTKWNTDTLTPLTQKWTVDSFGQNPNMAVVVVSVHTVSACVFDDLFTCDTLQGLYTIVVESHHSLVSHSTIAVSQVFEPLCSKDKEL